MDPNNTQPNDQQNGQQDYPNPAPAPPQQGLPQNNFNPDPVQPGFVSPAPPQQQQTPTSSQTDTLGIVSLIMIFIFPLVGVILGAIGLKKANKEGYKNTLSKIGLIINSILVVLGLIFFILWVFVFAAFSGTVNEIASEIEEQSQIASEQNPLDVTDASFVITTQSDIGRICEGEGWPSNATPSAAGNVVGLFSNRSTSPDFYSSEFASLTEYEDTDFDNPTIVDTVVCMTSVGQEPIATVTCQLTIDDVAVDAPMYRRPFVATAYSVSDKKEIASFTVQPESDCPFFVSVDPVDNSFDARIDRDSINAELNKAL